MSQNLQSTQDASASSQSQISGGFPQSETTLSTQSKPFNPKKAEQQQQQPFMHQASLQQNQMNIGPLNSYSHQAHPGHQGINPAANNQIYPNSQYPQAVNMNMPPLNVPQGNLHSSGNFQYANQQQNYHQGQNAYAPQNQMIPQGMNNYQGQNQQIRHNIPNNCNTLFEIKILDGNQIGGFNQNQRGNFQGQPMYPQQIGQIPTGPVNFRPPSGGGYGHIQQSQNFVPNIQYGGPGIGQMPINSQIHQQLSGPNQEFKAFQPPQNISQNLSYNNRPPHQDAAYQQRKQTSAQYAPVQNQDGHFDPQLNQINRHEEKPTLIIKGGNLESAQNNPDISHTNLTKQEQVAVETNQQVAHSHLSQPSFGQKRKSDSKDRKYGYDIISCSQPKTYLREDFVVKEEKNNRPINPNLKFNLNKKNSHSEVQKVQGTSSQSQIQQSTMNKPQASNDPYFDNEKKQQSLISQTHNNTQGGPVTHKYIQNQQPFQPTLPKIPQNHQINHQYLPEQQMPAWIQQSANNMNRVRQQAPINSHFNANPNHFYHQQVNTQLNVSQPQGNFGQVPFNALNNQYPGSGLNQSGFQPQVMHQMVPQNQIPYQGGNPVPIQNTFVSQPTNNQSYDQARSFEVSQESVAEIKFNPNAASFQPTKKKQATESSLDIKQLDQSVAPSPSVVVVEQTPLVQKLGTVDPVKEELQLHAEVNQESSPEIENQVKQRQVQEDIQEQIQVQQEIKEQTIEEQANIEQKQAQNLGPKKTESSKIVGKPKKGKKVVVQSSSSAVAESSSIQETIYSLSIQEKIKSSGKVSDAIEQEKLADLITATKAVVEKEGWITIEALQLFKNLPLSKSSVQNFSTLFHQELVKRKVRLEDLRSAGGNYRGKGRPQGNYNQPQHNRPARGGYNQHQGQKPYNQNPGSNPSREGMGQHREEGGGFVPKGEAISQEEFQFKRQEDDKFKEKLKAGSQAAIEKARQEKDVSKQIRLVINQITPDNRDKKFLELRKYMFGDLKVEGEAGYSLESDNLQGSLNKENMKIVVETIFRKAQKEKAYLNFYGELCENLIKLEMKLRQLKPTRKNISSSEIRTTLLDHCKLSFDVFFNPEIQSKRKTMDQEELFKYRQLLFGNILFVGELNRRQLLKESIIISVFDLLLAVESQSQLSYVNDDTVEGATVLMEKIGHLLDEQIKKVAKAETVQNPGPGDAVVTNTQKRYAASYQNIFKRFEQISSDEGNKAISQRIRILVKNMLDDRAQGWPKTKKQNESGPQKVDELRKQLEAKAREEEKIRLKIEEEEKQMYGGGSRNERGPAQRDRANTYQGGQGRGRGNRDQQDNQNLRGGRNSIRGTARGGNMLDQQNSYPSQRTQGQTNYTQKQNYQSSSEQQQKQKKETQVVVEISEGEAEARCLDSYKKFEEIIVPQNPQSPVEAYTALGAQKDIFQTFKDMQIKNGRKSEDLIFIFLNHAYNNFLPENKKYIPLFLCSLRKHDAVDKESMEKALSKLLLMPPDSADFEQEMAEILNILQEESLIVIKNIVWIKPQIGEGEQEDIENMVEPNYRIMAILLQKTKQSRQGDWSRVYGFFEFHELPKQFAKMKQYILEENIFDDIKEKLESEEDAKYIMPLLEADTEAIAKIKSTFKK